MSDEKFKEIDDKHDKHEHRINKLETNQLVHVEVHHSLAGVLDRLGARIKKIESDMSWGVKIILSVIVSSLVVAALVWKVGGDVLLK